MTSICISVVLSIITLYVVYKLGGANEKAVQSTKSTEEMEQTIQAVKAARDALSDPDVTSGLREKYTRR